MHTYRRRGAQQSRILYWFRTPPNVKVGRAALDEDAIRAIEQGNPNLSFDWDRMLKERPAPEPQAPPTFERRARPRPPAPLVERRRPNVGVPCRGAGARRRRRSANRRSGCHPAVECSRDAARDARRRRRAGATPGALCGILARITDRVDRSRPPRGAASRGRAAQSRLVGDAGRSACESREVRGAAFEDIRAESAADAVRAAADAGGTDRPATGSRSQLP